MDFSIVIGFTHADEEIVVIVQAFKQIFKESHVFIVRVPFQVFPEPSYGPGFRIFPFATGSVQKFVDAMIILPLFIAPVTSL